jgi:hypothetical protein
MGICVFVNLTATLLLPLPWPFFQPLHLLLQLSNHPALFQQNGDDDALKGNGAHGIEIFGKVEFCGAKHFIEQVLVFFA